MRAASWALQHAKGVTVIPSNDFSLYDHVLDTSVMVGAIPDSYGWTDGEVRSKPISPWRAVQMAMAMLRAWPWCRGPGNDQVVRHEYHYMLPEFTKGQRFRLSSRKPVDAYKEAKALATRRARLLVPVTYLLLGKSKDASLDPLSLTGELIPVYAELLRQLSEAGAAGSSSTSPASCSTSTPGRTTR